MEILQLASTVLPVFLLVFIGCLLRRFLRLDLSPLAPLSIYLFGPALTIYALSLRRFDAGMFLTLIASLAIFLILYLVSRLASSLLGLDQKHSTLIKCSAVMINASYLGLPITFLAFGADGLAHAAVFATVNTLICFSYGVTRISSTAAPAAAGKRHGSLQAGLARIPEFLKLPLFYSALLAIGLSAYGILLPGFILAPLQYLGSADILLGLLLLGGTLAITSLKRLNLGILALSSFIRLLLGPAIALGACLLLGLRGVAGSALILEAGMPVAVATIVLSTRYKNSQEAFASAVLVSTLLSLITLNLLLVVL